MTHEYAQDSAWYITHAPKRLIHFFRALWFGSFAFIVPWSGNYLFLCLSPPLDYNCLKEKGSFLCIFIIPAPSKGPGTEVPFGFVSSVGWHTVLMRPKFLTSILAALVSHSNDFATPAYSTLGLRLPSQMPMLNDLGRQLDRCIGSKPALQKEWIFGKGPQRPSCQVFYPWKTLQKLQVTNPNFILLNSLCIDH